MKIKNLFIIGNGFDLDHGFKTSYKAFGVFHGDVHADVLFPRGHENNWNDAENYFKAFFHDDMKRTILSCENHTEAKLINIWEEFKTTFITWITGENSEIKKSSDKNKYNFNGYENAHYINFNYTSTLQNIYGIDEANVTHIHGAVDLKDDLLFGSDSDLQNDKVIRDGLEKDYTGSMISEEIVSQINKEEREKIQNTLCSLHYKLFSKKTKENIKNKLSKLDLSNVESIYILGHSLNNLDSEYFGYIFEKAKKPFKVKCSFHSDDEKSYFREKLTEGSKNKHNMMELKTRQALEAKKKREDLNIFSDRVYGIAESDVEMIKMKDILILRTEKEVDCKMNTA